MWNQWLPKATDNRSYLQWYVWHNCTEPCENTAQGQCWSPTDLETVAAILWQSQKVQPCTAKGFGVLK